MHPSSRVLFLVYHGKGHFNACFHLARKLQETHKVLFAGVEFFRSHVTTQGFLFYPLKTVPFGLGLEEWMCTIQKRNPLYTNVLEDRWRDHLYKIRHEELKKLLDEYQPNTILLDAQQVTDFIVLYSYLKEREIKIALIHTMLPTALSEGVPPVNSLAMPGNTLEINHALRQARRKKWKRTWLQRLRYFGMDDTTIIRRRIKRNGIPKHYFSGQEIYYGCVLSNIHEFILIPKEFDFTSTVESSFLHYSGFQIDHQRIENFTPEYLAAKADIEQQIESKNSKLIYCSFGTLPLEKEEIIRAFLKKLIAAVDKTNAILLLSVNTNLGELKKMSNRVYFFSHVPQLDVLSYANLFITHGGLNSIKESVAHEVPMLVYPVEQQMDQPGNATRVVYHQLGLRGDLETDSSDEILSKIEKVLTASVYKEQILKLKTADSAYQFERLLAHLKV